MLSLLVLATTVSAGAIFRRVNPLDGFPPLAQYGICPTACGPIIEAQANPPPVSEYPSLCEDSFVATVDSCLACVRENLPPAALTPAVQEAIAGAVSTYETDCGIHDVDVVVSVPVELQPPVTITTTSGSSTYVTTIPASEFSGTITRTTTATDSTTTTVTDSSSDSTGSSSSGSSASVSGSGSSTGSGSGSESVSSTGSAANSDSTTTPSSATHAQWTGAAALIAGVAMVASFF